MITYLLDFKYNFTFLEALDHTPFHFIDHSLHVIYNKNWRLTQAIVEVKEEEVVKEAQPSTHYTITTMMFR